MLKSEKIIVRVANHKENSIDKISNFVRFLCYRSEYEKLSRAFSTMRSEIESHFPTVEDVNTIEPASLFPSPIGELHFSIPSPQPHVLSGTNRGIAGEK